MSWETLSSLVRYDLSIDGELVTLRVAGEIDVSSPQLVELIERVGCHRRVVLDMNRVGFIDARGLSLLLLAARRLRERGGELVVRRPHRAVRRLLRLYGSEVGIAVEQAPAWFQPGPDVVAIGIEAVEKAMYVGGGVMGALRLLDAAGALRVVAKRGLPQSISDFFEAVADAESASGAAWASGASVYVADVTQSPSFAGTPSLQAVLEAGIKSVGSVLLRAAAGTPIGTLSVARCQPGEWARAQQRQLEALADTTGSLLSVRSSSVPTSCYPAV